MGIVNTEYRPKNDVGVANAPRRAPTWLRNSDPNPWHVSSRRSGGSNLEVKEGNHQDMRPYLGKRTLRNGSPILTMPLGFTVGILYTFRLLSIVALAIQRHPKLMYMESDTPSLVHDPSKPSLQGIQNFPHETGIQYASNTVQIIASLLSTPPPLHESTTPLHLPLS
jgi:hypothetical protein